MLYPRQTTVMTLRSLIAPTLALLAAPLLLVPAWAMSRPPAVPAYAARVEIGPARRALPLPPIAGPSDAKAPLIVIDAGHGGHDPGSVAADPAAMPSPSLPSRVDEKDLTLAIARAMRTRLLAEGRFRVALTRDSDRFLVLAERYDLARRLQADLFLSIHADSAPNDAAAGATLYTLSDTASDQEAERLALRENKSDLLNGVDLSTTSAAENSILIDLKQREALAAASRVAALIARESRAVPFRPDPHRFAGFVVLKAPDVPSILYETGYLTNAADLARLRSADGQGAIAEGAARALRIHFAQQSTAGRR